MLDDSEAVRHMHLSKERVKEVDEGAGWVEDAGVITHFQDSPEHPGLSETVPALPAGHLGKGVCRKGEIKEGKG